MKDFTVKAILHFPDGVNRGQLTVKASDKDEARKIAMDKLRKTWGLPESSIDILDVR